MRKTQSSISAFCNKLDAIMSSCTIVREGTPTHNIGDMHININQLRTFLGVCMNEGCNGTEIAEILGLSQSTASAHLLKLSFKHQNNKPGFGLVQVETHPTSLREKVYTLTPKGRALAAIIANIAE